MVTTRNFEVISLATIGFEEDGGWLLVALYQGISGVVS